MSVVTAFKNDIRAACNQLESDIQNATSVSEVEAVDISEENIKVLAGY